MTRDRRRRIRVALVDDQPVVRQGLEASLARQPRLRIVAAAADVEEALARSTTFPPDVFIVDADSPASAARRIRKRFPLARVVVFSSVDSEEQVREAARGAIQGYVRRTAPVEDIVRAIETVHA
ncbi:MAG: response regulator, partial [Vicinamibacteria bacterium]